MWFELWASARWLLASWLLLLIGCGVIAAVQVKPPLTFEEEGRLLAAPQEVFRALKLEPGAEQPLKPGESRFTTFNDAARDFDCASFSENLTSIQERLNALPDDVFLLETPFRVEGQRTRFDWRIQRAPGVRYVGTLDAETRRLCLKRTTFSWDRRSVAAQWQGNFVSASFGCLPFYTLGVAIFSLVVMLKTKRAILQWVMGLALLSFGALTFYLAYWFFYWFLLYSRGGG